jgi:hypothetical protein
LTSFFSSSAMTSSKRSGWIMAITYFMTYLLSPA